LEGCNKSGEKLIFLAKENIIRKQKRKTA